MQLGINKETGQEVAIKTIKKSKIETDADLIRIRREVQIMSSVQHPNIIHIYEGNVYIIYVVSSYNLKGSNFGKFQEMFEFKGCNWAFRIYNLKYL